METLTDNLLARIATKANDPGRRYKNAAEDEARVELPVEEIDRREEAWTRRKLAACAAASGQEMPSEEQERRMDEWRASRDAARSAMDAQMRAWGQTPPRTKSFIETDDFINASNEPAGAKPLRTPPTPGDWQALERIVGRPIPNDLKRLYTISDGGFGPGFTGLHSVQLIGSSCEDYRRRGPDYCGAVAYPYSFIPLTTDMLEYHLDLDSGRIISSNQNWENDGLDPEDIYDIAFQSLASMMEDWLNNG